MVQITGNKGRFTPMGALKAICDILQSEYSKGKRKVNINRIWNIADSGLNYEYDTSSVSENVEVSTETVCLPPFDYRRDN